MKVAVTASEPNLEAQVDSRFGRAQYFLIVDADTFDFEAVDNQQNLNAEQGAGVQAARIVSSHGAETLLTGHCGPKAFEALKAAGVTVLSGATGTVREAVESFKRGEIQPLEAPDVEGHW